MAAITKRLLHLRPNFHSYARPQPYPLYHFSSSSDPDAHSDDPQPDPNSDAQTRPSLSSVKSSIQQQPPPQNRNVFPHIPSLSTVGSTDNIHRQLSEFRVRSAAPPPPSSPGYSMQQLYEKNVNAKSGDSADSSGISSVGKHSFDHIGASLLRPNPGAQNGSGGKVSDRWSRFNASKVSKPFTWGRTNDLHKELGEKLKTLRPQNRKGKWFSLQELSDRLAKMKQTEEKERNLMNNFKSVTSIRDGILGTALQKQGKAPMKNLGFLGSIVGTESHLLLPPKENLVEKFFHPDNMSSAEKIKLELKKVRDEFKMSESDCGSARVQVAQLTTKIKHLSTVLRKKDKHSRKGLQAMVQRRKKLLKYLRRTDWDSYCLVLSKLGLRDNPDVKA